VNTEENIYIPAALEVIEVVVESGFAGSDEGMTLPEWGII